MRPINPGIALAFCALTFDHEVRAGEVHLVDDLSHCLRGLVSPAQQLARADGVAFEAIHEGEELRLGIKTVIVIRMIRLVGQGVHRLGIRIDPRSRGFVTEPAATRRIGVELQYEARHFRDISGRSLKPGISLEPFMA